MIDENGAWETRLWGETVAAPLDIEDDNCSESVLLIAKGRGTGDDKSKRM